jgi:hypothetical protein
VDVVQKEKHIDANISNFFKEATSTQFLKACGSNWWAVKAKDKGKLTGNEMNLMWSSLSEFLATDPEVLGSIPGASRFYEKQWVWNGVHSAP